MNFQTVNAKNFEDGIWKNCENMTYLFTEILMIGWHAEIEKRLCKKTKATELQIWKNHTTLLTPAHLTCNTLVLSSHIWIKTKNLIIRKQFRGKIKRQMLHKKVTHYNKTEQKHITYVFCGKKRKKQITVFIDNVYLRDFCYWSFFPITVS